MYHVTTLQNIRNEEVNQLAEKPATRKHINKTEAVELALQNELRRLDEVLPLRERCGLRRSSPDQWLRKTFNNIGTCFTA
jgi:hypothetical protein